MKRDRDTRCCDGHENRRRGWVCCVRAEGRDPRVTAPASSARGGKWVRPRSDQAIEPMAMTTLIA